MQYFAHNVDKKVNKMRNKNCISQALKNEIGINKFLYMKSSLTAIPSSVAE